MIGNRDTFLDRTELEKNFFLFNHCGIQECTPGYSYSFETQPYQLVHFILKGNGFFEFNQKLFNVHAGQAFYIPSGTPAKYYASLNSPWKYAWIGFYSNTENPFIKLLFKNKNIVNINMPLYEIEDKIVSIISVTDNRFTNRQQYDQTIFKSDRLSTIGKLSDSLKVNSIMLNFFSDLIKSQAVEDSVTYETKNSATKVKAFIDTHYNEPIKIQDVAKSLCLHPNYLCSVFKKNYNQTPSNYLRSIRMAQASMLLILTDYPISKIAESLGYPNPFQFSTIFKSYYGVSPLAYRKRGE